MKSRSLASHRKSLKFLSTKGRGSSLNIEGNRVGGPSMWKHVRGEHIPDPERRLVMSRYFHCIFRLHTERSSEERTTETTSPPLQPLRVYCSLTPTGGRLSDVLGFREPGCWTFLDLGNLSRHTNLHLVTNISEGYSWDRTDCRTIDRRFLSEFDTSLRVGIFDTLLFVHDKTW